MESSLRLRAYYKCIQKPIYTTGKLQKKHVLVEVGQMVAQDVAEPVELGCALVSKAELEGLGRGHCVQRLGRDKGYFDFPL